MIYWNTQYLHESGESPEKPLNCSFTKRFIGFSLYFSSCYNFPFLAPSTIKINVCHPNRRTCTAILIHVHRGGGGGSPRGRFLWPTLQKISEKFIFYLITFLFIYFFLFFHFYPPPFLAKNRAHVRLYSSKILAAKEKTNVSLSRIPYTPELRKLEYWT